MVIVLRILAVLALLISLAWLLLTDFGFEQVLAFVVALSALIATFLEKKKHGRQGQKVSNSSFGIQAGGDVHIDNGDSAER